MSPQNVSHHWIRSRDTRVAFLPLLLSVACGSSSNHQGIDGGGASAGLGGSDTVGESGAGGRGSGTISSGLGGAGTSGGTAAIVVALPAAVDPSGISGLPICALAQNGTCLTPITRTKDDVCERWNTDFPRRSVTDYTQPAEACSYAELTPGGKDDVLRRINLFRWLSGVEPVTIDEAASSEAGACAIIQSHLSSLNHYPPADATCYNSEGGAACARSLLHSGAPSPAAGALGLYGDFGDNNLHILGHRRALLTHNDVRVGVGFAAPTGAREITAIIPVVDPLVEARNGPAGLVAAPNYGIVPYELFYPGTYEEFLAERVEWHVGFDGNVDFTSATARIYRLGSSGYELLPSESGSLVNGESGLWIVPGIDVVPPGEYLVLVDGTEIGDFGYRIKIEHCAGDVPLTCDLIAQDCGVSGYGCYHINAPGCERSGNLPIGSGCSGRSASECVSGATCAENTNLGGFECVAFCQVKDQTATQYCPNICPNSLVCYSLGSDVNPIEGCTCQPGGA